MPLEKEFSLVADSTTSSSPARATDASEPIKRPTRTYGRPRDQPVVEDHPSDISYINSTSMSFDTSIHQTAPPGLREKVPTSSPSNDNDDPAGGDSDGDTAPDASSRYTFGWKDKLKMIDEEGSSDDDNAREVDDAPQQSLFGNALLLQNAKDESSLLNSTTSSHSSLHTSSASDDVFGGPPSSPSQGPSEPPSFTLSSPSSPPRKRGVKSKSRTTVIDSDEEIYLNSSSTAASTSSKHLINTPRSSSTQPTSEDDMPPKPKTKRLRPTVGRRSSSRQSVPPLDFMEMPASNAKKSKRDKKGKAKEPTKKDKEEIVKERGRMAAQTHISIPKVENKIFTVQGLLARMAGSSEIPPLIAASDPIEPFSSPHRVGASPEKKLSFARSSERAKTPPSNNLPELEDSDDGLPDTRNMMKQNASKLKDLKQRALEQSTRHLATGDEDDDDLEVVRGNPKVVAKEEAESRRSGQKPRVSTAMKMVAQLAHVNTAKQARKSDVRSPGGVQKHFNSVIVKHTTVGTSAELSRLTFAKAQEVARRETRKKEDEWQKHGGRLGAKSAAPGQDLATTLQDIARKGREVVSTGGADRMDVDGDDEDPEDEDYNPALRGSASPEPEGEEEELDEEEGAENDENLPISVDADITMVAEDDDSEEHALKVRTRRNVVVASDSEEDGNDENDENAPIKQSPVLPSSRYRRSSTSSDLMTEEEDKENNTRLMYDRSEDKENTRIVRHTPLSATPTSIFDLHALASTTSSPENRRQGFPGESSDDDTAGREPGSAKRRPFQDLLSEDSPKSTGLQPTNLTQSFASKLQQASPLPSTLAPAPTLKAFLGEGSSTKSFSGGFSQFPDGEGDVFGAAPLQLQPSFSDLFESATEKQKSPKRLKGLGKLKALSSDESFSDENNKNGLKRTDTLDLTQQLGFTQEQGVKDSLRPAFQPDGAVLRKADAIFEKEQEFLLEANTRKPTRQNTELYVNDLGFLTQTKPLDGPADVYRRSPAQSIYGSMLSPSQARNLTQTLPRAPLRTLSYTSATPLDSPEQTLGPRRRLRKLSDTPSRSQSGSVSPPPVVQPRQPNAFELMALAQKKQKKDEERKQRRKDIGDYLEDQAAESDEEDKFGFVKGPKNDDEEEGEDLDKTLDVLMDDAVMDEATEAADKVWDKFKEHQEEDDKKAEELARAAVQGELRKNKRRHGVGVDDDSDDEDDDENDRARRAMKKLRKSDRGDIQAMEANPDTQAFAASYNSGLKDDDENEFAYMGRDSSADDVLQVQQELTDERKHDSENEDMYEPVDEEHDEEEEEREHVETISRRQLDREVAAAVREKNFKEFDTQDVSWIDEEMEDDKSLIVKTVNSRSRPRPRLQDGEELDGPLFRKSTVLTSEASKSWHKQESKSRNAGTARSVGGSAITGHAKSKSKTVAAGPVRKGVQGASSSSSSVSTAGKPMRAAASMLSIVDKGRLFE